MDNAACWLPPSSMYDFFSLGMHCNCSFPPRLITNHFLLLTIDTDNRGEKKGHSKHRSVLHYCSVSDKPK